jgi:hypothetical protein
MVALIAWKRKRLFAYFHSNYLPEGSRIIHRSSRVGMGRASKLHDRALKHDGPYQR